MYNINWKPKAYRQLNKIDKTDRKKIIIAVDSLASFSTVKNIKRLINHQFNYRLRIGNYRVLFDVDTVVRIIDIQEVKKRDDNTY